MLYNKIFLFFVLALLIKFANAQDDYRKEWYIGIRNYKIDFNGNIPIVNYMNDDDTTPNIIKGNANISDSSGHILLATDGIKLYGSDGKFISGGGENINNDSLTWDYNFDNAYPNSSIVLPKGNNQYYIFIVTMSDAKWSHYYANPTDTFDFDEIRYSIVDMNANGGKGEITVKNKLLVHTDEYPWVNKSNFTACRHANGRDWWLLKPSARMRQKMYKFLVRPDTIITYIENMPLSLNTWAYDNRGQSAFNMDATQYAECNQFGPHTIYNFDRCSGELSLKRVIDLLPFKDTFGNAAEGGNYPTWGGLCFSPNGRFLYTCDYYNVIGKFK